MERNDYIINNPECLQNKIKKSLGLESSKNFTKKKVEKSYSLRLN